MKLFIINKEHNSLAVTLPKRLLEAMSWKRGDELEAMLGKDKAIVLRKKEEQPKQELNV